MSDEEDALEKWRKEQGIPDEEMQRMFSPELRVAHLIEKLVERVKVNDQEARQRDEEQQLRIYFIVEQQAQFAVDMRQFAAGMQQLHEAQARAEEKWGGMWERTNAGINALLAAAQIQSHQIDGLAEAQANTDRQMAETNDRLNALINVVEQFIGESRNGG
jgi:hypothetical protein